MSDHILMSTKDSPSVYGTPNNGLPYLPAELQDMIFRHCLASGNTEVLQLSKNTHSRISPFLYRDAFLRLGRDYFERNVNTSRASGTLPPSNISLIRNISINTDEDYMEFLLDKTLQPVLNFSLPRWTTNTKGRAFHITFSREDHMLCTDIGVLGRAISGLTTFETVTVTAITTPPKLKKEEDNYRSHPRVFRGRNKQTYEIFQGIWEDTLGPAKFYDSPGQEGRYLEFRPRAHLV